MRGIAVTSAVTVFFCLTPSPVQADPAKPADKPCGRVCTTDSGLLATFTEISVPQKVQKSQQAAADTKSSPAEPTRPTCLEAGSDPDCEPVRVCEPFEGSPTGYSVWVYGYQSGSMVGQCSAPEAAGTEPARITPGRVLQAFRRIPLPAAKLDIQPPGGKTLVNLDTIFSTTTGDLDRTVTLLGRRVQLRITPASYTWHHGDGTTQTSDWPGRPWEQDLDMSTYLTHAYEDAHVTVRPSVDVTYTADYRIGNGPWQPVDGTVTIDGPPSALRIVEARPVLTGDGRP